MFGHQSARSSHDLPTEATSNDDSRGNESPDRQDASSETDDETSSDDPQPIRAGLETIDELTRTLLEEIRPPHPNALEGCPRDDRREIRRRLREIRAEASQIRLFATGPEAAIPYRSRDADESNDPRTGVSVYSEPATDPLERDDTDSDETHPEESHDDTGTEFEIGAEGLVELE